LSQIGQSIGWSISSASSTRARLSITLSLSVTITVPSLTGVWQPGTSLGTIVILPVSASRWPVSIRHIRQLATTERPGCQQ
jgi:hypothetical protein